ncbi:MAG: hypothetical protein II767_04375 [Proteobacteria bacterium]|nr:hypothetical protein [Pseudomonadota bacterium]
MNRKTIYAIVIATVVVVLALVGVLAFMLSQRSTSSSLLNMEQVQRRKPMVKDKYAGMDQEAIKIVQDYEVYKPEYIDALVEHMKTKKPIGMEPSRVTINELVEQQFLENHFNMHYLKKGEWRALHLDTDTGENGNQIPDPQYEVYLDFHDESVVVGPVWIVDVTNKTVIPRNDMASIFDRDLINYDEVEENLKRPEAVVSAITSHKFENGIDLGGVFLLDFFKKTDKKDHMNDEIIGWTVMHEFQDEFSAYYQWRELGEVRVAKFRFNWKTKTFVPKGLQAIDLMAIGENMSSIKPIDIYPNGYTNNLNIPRTERWAKGNTCRDRDYRELCTAFVKVLEQQEFINALAWLLTNGQADATDRINRCKADKKCGWIPKMASGELNPKEDTALIEVDYKYELKGRQHEIRFLVDSNKETITPLDKMSQMAYWAVTPRT